MMPQNTAFSTPAPADNVLVTFWKPTPDATMIGDPITWAELRTLARKHHQDLVPLWDGYTLACWDHTRPAPVRALRPLAVAA